MTPIESNVPSIEGVANIRPLSLPAKVNKLRSWPTLVSCRLLARVEEPPKESHRTSCGVYCV